MKKILLPLLAALLCVLPSCQVQEISPETACKTVTVQFTSEPLETRVAFDARDGHQYPTLWKEGDKVAVDLFSDLNKNFTAQPTVSADGKTITFTGSVTGAAEKDRFFAISPAGSVLSRNNTYKHWNLAVPASQTPTALSPDPDAMLVWAQSDEFTAVPENISLTFKHVTAYGNLSFYGFNLGDAKLEAVSLSSSVKFVGRYFFFLADATKDGKDYKAGDFQENAPSGDLTINTSTTENIWFSCFPFDMSGASLKVTAITDKGTYTKDITLPDGFKFESGKVTTIDVNMAGIELVKPVTYKRITSESQLKAGDEVILAAMAVHPTTYVPLGDFAITNQQKSNNRAAAAVTVTGSDEDEICDPAANIEIFTVEAGATAGTWSFKATKTPGYIYAAATKESSANWFRTAETAGSIDNFDLRRSWTVTFNESYAKIQSQLVTLQPTWATVLQFNTNEAVKTPPNLMFSCYVDGKYPAFGGMDIYKKVTEEDEGPYTFERQWTLDGSDGKTVTDFGVNFPGRMIQFNKTDQYIQSTGWFYTTSTTTSGLTKITLKEFEDDPSDYYFIVLEVGRDKMKVLRHSVYEEDGEQWTTEEELTYSVVEPAVKVEYIKLMLALGDKRFNLCANGVDLLLGFVQIAQANGGKLPIVNVGGAGAESDYASLDVTGKVAVVKRGSITFSAKQAAAAKAGAVGLLIVNTDESDFYPIADGNGIPYAGVTGAAESLLADKTEVEMIHITKPE